MMKITSLSYETSPVVRSDKIKILKTPTRVRD